MLITITAEAAQVEEEEEEEETSRGGTMAGGIPAGQPLILLLLFHSLTPKEERVKENWTKLKTR